MIEVQLGPVQLRVFDRKDDGSPRLELYDGDTRVVVARPSSLRSLCERVDLLGEDDCGPMKVRVYGVTVEVLGRASLRALKAAAVLALHAHTLQPRRGPRR